MKGGRSVGRHLALVVLPLLWVTLALPVSSEAAVTCTFTGGAVRIEMSEDNDSVRITRFGSEITVLAANEYSPVLQPRVGCAGGSPTVITADSVTIRQNPDTEDQKLNIDLSNGPFSPGATSEADMTSEIELSLDMASDTDLAIIGSAAPESFMIGLITPAVVGVNLNAGEAVPDFDLEVSGTKDLAILGRGAPDLLDGRGVPRASGSRTHLPIQLLSGGSGDDQLFAGGLQSQISGGSGNDLLSGSMGTDLLSGDRGHDVVTGGKGKDFVFSVDHKRDRIKCGASRDSAFADRRDKVKRCERLERTGRRIRAPIVIKPFE